MIIRALFFTAGALLGTAASWAVATVLTELDQIRLGEEPYLWTYLDFGAGGMYFRTDLAHPGAAS